MILSILGLFFSYNAYANKTIECKELDFSSYHKAERAKGNLIRSYPDRKYPNFSEKYLLLKNDYLFESEWFLADCITGKFIKDTLSTDHNNPVGIFKLDSNQLEIRSSKADNKTPVEYHVFQNEKWMRIDPNSKPTPTPTPATSPLNNNLKTTNAPTCKPLDYDSNSRAQSNKKNLISSNPDQSQPNFSRHYLLLKGETIFQNYWLIVDCNTGKFFSDLITGNIEFNLESNKIKQFNSGDFPNYSYWLEEGSQWFSEHGNNTIHGNNAKTLFESLPNKEKSSIIRFENLKWKLENIEINIKEGKCISENKKYTCHLEIE